jgi:hypothetical protein
MIAAVAPEPNFACGTAPTPLPNPNLGSRPTRDKATRLEEPACAWAVRSGEWFGVSILSQCIS